MRYLIYLNGKKILFIYHLIAVLICLNNLEKSIENHQEKHNILSCRTTFYLPPVTIESDGHIIDIYSEH